MLVDIPLEELVIGSIALSKWSLSQKAGHDVGVPATVDAIIKDAQYMRLRRKLYNSTPHVVLQGDFRQFLLECGDALPSREKFILAYLIHYPNLADEHGKDQLDGELKRYLARKQGIKPSEVKINRMGVQEYLIDNGLGAELASTGYFLGHNEW